jgi:DNA-binding HxlR family transcriptional regulator
MCKSRETIPLRLRLLNTAKKLKISVLFHLRTLTLTFNHLKNTIKRIFNSA